MKNKLLTTILTIIFLWQNCLWASAPGSLRPRAAIDRATPGGPASNTWLQESVPELADKVAVSFTMECCIYEFQPDVRDGNFAGGLGIAEADLVNGCGKIGMNAAGIVPLYARRIVQKVRWGKQVFDIMEFSRGGNPVEEIMDKLEEARDRNNIPIEFDVWGMDLANTSKDRPYHVKVYKVKREGRPLYLFWCPEVFDFLYPGDEQHNGNTKRNRRFLQETLFGRCVAELFKRVNFLPDIYHFNEGHTADVIAAMHELDDPNRKSFVYVNHSALDAALEKFPIDQVDGGTEEWIRYLAMPSPTHYQEDWDRFVMRLPDGRKVMDMSGGALNVADVGVGVSREHAEETQKLFPWYPYKIKDVLNGSGDFWVMDELLEKKKRGIAPTKEDLLRINKEGQEIAFRLIKERTQDMTNSDGRLICENGIDLDPNKPTVWLVHRLAEYKSQMPILKDIIRVVCAEKWQEVDTKWGTMRGLGMQVVVGGIGMDDWVEEFVRWMGDPQLKGKFVFVPGSGSELLKAQAIGGGVCLSCPLPRKEACGTSDQRKARNGGINIATHSGGPPEYIVDGVSGFLVGPYENDAHFCERASKDILEKLVLCSDMYYSHQEKGDTRWPDMMLASYLASERVTDEAMAQRYAKDVYRSALRIKRLYSLGKKIGELALQQAGQQPGQKAKQVNIIFAGPQDRKKTEVMDSMREILRRTGVAAEITDEAVLSGPESLTFDGDTIVLNTDVISNGFLDKQKFERLVNAGIRDVMRERHMSATPRTETIAGRTGGDPGFSI